MRITLEWAPYQEAYAAREFLGVSLRDHRAAFLARFPPAESAAQAWTVRIASPFVLDAAGWQLIQHALTSYRGQAARLRFSLAMDEYARRDYYSLQPDTVWNGSCLQLPIQAERRQGQGEDVLTIELPTFPDQILLPQSMGGDLSVSVPLAVLMPLQGDFDVLFANQIGIFSNLARRVRKSPSAWINAALKFRHAATYRQRTALAYRCIHPEAQVHPTALIEGSIVGRGAVIGAHAVVRYSLIGEYAQLRDGAKVEFSVVGNNACLMHDLVFYRSTAEQDVFLIHGPYQFSIFQKASSAFATILMDYRPDGGSIHVQTEHGLKAYAGRFLGAVVRERAKLLGGCLLASGRIVPTETWLSADTQSIHALTRSGLPVRVPVSPLASRKDRHEEKTN